MAKIIPLPLPKPSGEDLYLEAYLRAVKLLKNDDFVRAMIQRIKNDGSIYVNLPSLPISND